MRPSLLAAALVVFVASNARAQKRPKCIGDVPDSLFALASPVYRNCEVDTPAKALKKSQAVNQSFLPFAVPAGRCLVAGFTFVIDTLGFPELYTIRAQPNNSPEVEDVVLELVKGWRFEPAMLNGQPVRQSSVYRAAFGSSALPTGRSGGSPASIQPARSCKP